MACPCGFTQEQLLAAPDQLLGLGGVCIAFRKDKSLNPDGSRAQCGELAIDHPLAPPEMKLSGDVGRRTAWGMESDQKLGTVPSAPIFVADKFSASTIANFHRNYYNIFSLPCSSNSCFIPNIRLRSLVAAFEALSDDHSDVRQIELKLRSGMFSVDTWEFPPGSETVVSDPNIQHYLGMIVSHARKPGIVLKNGAQQIPARMAGPSKSESRIVSSNGFILIGNEVKGFQHSQYEAMTQGFQIGGDGVLALRLEGNLELGNCAVPVILGFSDSIQIYGVYLLPESVPVFTPLSSPVSYLTFEGRLYLSRWAIALSNFAVGTETLLQNSRRDFSPRVQAFSLSRFLFYKPIISQFYSLQGPGLLTCRRSSLDSMMNLYRDLFLQERATDYILFPLGLLSFPGNDLTVYAAGRQFLNDMLQKHFELKLVDVRGTYPIVVFELLNEDWKNTKPEASLRESYLASLEVAVEVMNSAGVAHMDLRPANVMWRCVGDTVQIRIIDFEDALKFGTLIRVNETLRNDCRYPFPHLGVVQVSSVHNSWFLAALASWVKEETLDDGFSTHMQTHHSALLAEMRTDLMECYREG